MEFYLCFVGGILQFCGELCCKSEPAHCNPIINSSQHDAQHAVRFCCKSEPAHSNPIIHSSQHDVQHAVRFCCAFLRRHMCESVC